MGPSVDVPGIPGAGLEVLMIKPQNFLQMLSYSRCSYTIFVLRTFYVNLFTKKAFFSWNKLTKYFKGTSCREKTLGNIRILVKFEKVYFREIVVFLVFTKVYSRKVTQFSTRKILFSLSKKIKTFCSFLLCSITGKPWTTDMFLKVNVLSKFEKFIKLVSTLIVYSLSYKKIQSSRTLHKKCPYSELFWSAFTCICTEYIDIPFAKFYSIKKFWMSQKHKLIP